MGAKIAAWFSVHNCHLINEAFPFEGLSTRQTRILGRPVNIRQSRSSTLRQRIVWGIITSDRTSSQRRAEPSNGGLRDKRSINVYCASRYVEHRINDCSASSDAKIVPWFRVFSVKLFSCRTSFIILHQTIFNVECSFVLPHIGLNFEWYSIHAASVISLCSERRLSSCFSALPWQKVQAQLPWTKFPMVSHT